MYILEKDRGHARNGAQLGTEEEMRANGAPLGKMNDTRTTARNFGRSFRNTLNNLTHGVGINYIAHVSENGIRKSLIWTRSKSPQTSADD